MAAPTAPGSPTAPVSTPQPPRTADDRSSAPSKAPILRYLENWYADHHEELTAAGFTVALHRSPPDRTKTSVWLDMDSPQRMTELIIWDTGEAELEFADINTGRATPQHHQIAEPSDVDDVLARQLAWLGYTTDSQPST